MQKKSSINNTASQGYVMLAFGKPVFMQFAFNMMLSLRANGTKLPIQLIHDYTIENLTDAQQAMFDVLTEIDEKHIRPNKNIEAGYAKVHLYDYLAFDESIYLDVDGVVFKNIDNLFEQNQDFKVQGDELHWVDGQEQLKAKYGTNNVQGSNSSIMFIRKGEQCEKLFNEAQKAIKNPIKDLANSWFGMQPDELYLGVGMDKANVKEPYFDGKYLLYLRRRIDYQGLTKLDDIKEQFIGVGVYGNKTYNHHLSYKLYNQENQRNWMQILGMSSRPKIDKLMRLKR